MPYIDANGGLYENPQPGIAETYVSPSPSVWHSWTGTEWVYDVARHRADAKERIDAHAGATRDRFVSPGQLIDQEYCRAYEKATEWLADQTRPVPACVQSWADAQGWTALQAAQDIEATGNSWYGLLDQIRDIRLKKKSLVDAAATEAEVEQIVQDARAEFDAL